MRINRHTLATAGLLLMLPGCFRPIVEGRVVNGNGKAIPGVVVQLVDTDRQALTDARGDYKIRYAPGRFELAYSKSGYAPTVVTLENAKRRRLLPDDVRLWKLPGTAGVFLYQDFGYERAAWVFPQQFFMADGSLAHGTQHDPESVAFGEYPDIICYNTPRYDAKLSRLLQVEAKQPSGSNRKNFDVWVAGGSINVNLIPVDPKDGTLLRLEVLQALQPGAYALHWGALEGYTTLDKRMFLFEVAEPPEPEPDPEPELALEADPGAPAEGAQVPDVAETALPNAGAAADSADTIPEVLPPQTPTAPPAVESVDLVPEILPSQTQTSPPAPQ